MEWIQNGGFEHCNWTAPLFLRLVPYILNPFYTSHIFRSESTESCFIPCSVILLARTDISGHAASNLGNGDYCRASLVLGFSQRKMQETAKISYSIHTLFLNTMRLLTYSAMDKMLSWQLKVEVRKKMVVMQMLKRANPRAASGNMKANRQGYKGRETLAEMTPSVKPKRCTVFK